MKFSFIHAADMHLGRTFSELSAFQYDETFVKKIKKAEEKALNNIVNFAISRKVDFILIAGDTLDSADKDFASKLLLKRTFEKLESAGIQVFAVCGNHDPLYAYGKSTFNFDENSKIKIIGLNTPVYGSFPIYKNTGEQICVLHALSYEGDTYYNSPFQFFTRPDENEKNFFNTALVHCDVNAPQDGCYGPCRAQDIANLDYDYYALGHIHVPQNFGDKIFYSGTMQGKTLKETGAHGIRYIEAQDRQITKNEFIPVDVVRYEQANIDLSNTTDITSVFEEIWNNISLKINTKTSLPEINIVRINLTGIIRCSQDLNENFYEATAEKIYEYSAGKIVIEKISNFTHSGADEALLSEDTGIIGEIMKTVSDENILNETFDEVFNSLSSLTYKCDFSQEEISELKKQTIGEAKEACVNFCSYIYDKESEQ